MKPDWKNYDLGIAVLVLGCFFLAFLACGVVYQITVLCQRMSSISCPTSRGFERKECLGNEGWTGINWKCMLGYSWWQISFFTDSGRNWSIYNSALLGHMHTSRHFDVKISTSEDLWCLHALFPGLFGSSLTSNGCMLLHFSMWTCNCTFFSLSMSNGQVQFSVAGCYFYFCILE